MERIEALRIERDMLGALVAAAPRGRPEIVARLRLVTTELLRLELGGDRESQKSGKPERPLAAVPEFPESEGHELRYFQR